MSSDEDGDYYNDPPAAPSAKSAKASWTKLDNRRLWALYESGEIDPNNNGREYLLGKSQLHFPAHSHNPETAIRRLRDKNKQRIVQLRQDAQVAGKNPLFCCLRTRQKNSRRDSPAAAMPPARAARVAAGAGGGAPPALPAPPNDPIGDLAGQMSRVSVADTYSLKSHHPYIMMKTPYTDGNARKVIIDIWVQSMHQDNFRVDINPEGTEVSVSMRMPDIFYDPARLGREMTLVGARDAIQNAFDEAVDKVMSDHGTSGIWTDPEVIPLPFKCDNEFTKVICWNEGDRQLFDELSADPNVERAWHQMFPVLRVTLISSTKRLNKAWQAPTMAIMPGGMSSPGGEDDDSMPDVFPVPPPDLNLPPSPSQQPAGAEGVAEEEAAHEQEGGSYRSTGGPASFVPSGLFAETLRREARASQRATREREEREETKEGENDDDVSL